jgi:hypothetical protein
MLLTAIVMLAVSLLVQPVFAQQLSDLLKPYEAVSTALANDDLAAAKKAAGELAEKAKTVGNNTIAEHADELAKSASIEAARDCFKAMADGSSQAG